jgi:hypothetical protein
MHHKDRTIQHRAEINLKFGGPCRVPRCGRPRLGAHHYCQNHVRAWRRYGHPEGVRTYPRDYATYRTKVRALLAQCPDHVGALAATAWLAAWIERAARGEPVAAHTQLARLHEQEVCAERVLEELAAVWTLATVRPRNLPDDERLTFALANAMFYLAPRAPLCVYRSASGGAIRRYSPIPRADREAAGKTIREGIGRLLANLAHTIAAATADASVAPTELEIQRAFTAPFVLGQNLRISTTTTTTTQSQ